MYTQIPRVSHIYSAKTIVKIQGNTQGHQIFVKSIVKLQPTIKVHKIVA